MATNSKILWLHGTHIHIPMCVCMYVSAYKIFFINYFYSVWCTSSALEVIQMNIHEETEYGLKVKV